MGTQENLKNQQNGKRKIQRVPVWFTMKAPKAKAVQLAGDFTQWEIAAQPMKLNHEGEWETRVSLPTGTHQYKFIVDGQWANDPMCSKSAPDGFGAANSVIEVK